MFRGQRSLLECQDHRQPFRFPPARSISEAFDFAPQISLRLSDVLIAQGVMFGGIRFDLRAVEANLTNFEETQLFGQKQYLQEQPRGFKQNTTPKICDRIMVGASISVLAAM
jgi:hypothetical protein